MGIKPIFDINNTIAMPTLILCNRNKHRLGTLTPAEDFEITPDLSGLNELSFKIYKNNNGVQHPLWDKIKDLKLLYIPEYNEYFELEISKEESDQTVKSIIGKNLGIAELSQTILYDIEINTEADIARDDYEIAKVYDSETPKTSLLCRILSKAPHYTIKHVDASIAEQVRSFSIDNTSIYDFLTNDLANELNCLVSVGSDRTVSLYDLENVGTDTAIYISKDNLAETITLEVNKDNIKNTFRVQGGDDVINAAIAACNPNGTCYINRFSEDMLSDMSAELSQKLGTYDSLYNSKLPEYKATMQGLYDSIDKKIYLESGMMPKADLETGDTSPELTEVVTGGSEASILQKLENILADAGLNSTDTYDWTKYCLNRLISFSDAYQSCLDVLISAGFGDISHEFHDTVYIPYFNQKSSVDAEIKVREAQITEQESLQANYISTRNSIQAGLNLENYLGNLLWKEFCAFRREDTYQNDNYISDGLSGAELIRKAEELIETANKELYQASEPQYTLSSTIGNLFAIKEFEPLKDTFAVGNWIRIHIDNETYRLRLIDYTIRNDDISHLPVNFSNTVRIPNGISDIQSVLNTSKSMASSYECVKRQAKRSEATTDTVKTWTEKGMDAAAVSISNSKEQTVVYDEHGLLCRRYDDVTETYAAEQLKLVNNTLAITDDNWHSVKSAIGEIYYEDTVTGELVSAYGVIGQTIVGKLLLGEALGIYNEGGSMRFTADGLEITNGVNTFKVNPNDKSRMFSLTKGDSNVLYIDENGNGVFNGSVYASNGEFTGTVTATSGSFKGNVNADTLTANSGGTIAGWKISSKALYKGTSSLSSTTAGTYLGTDGIRQYSSSQKYINIINGEITAKGANIEGNLISNNANITGGSISVSNNNSAIILSDGQLAFKYSNASPSYFKCIPSSDDKTNLQYTSNGNLEMISHDGISLHATNSSAALCLYHDDKHNIFVNSTWGCGVFGGLLVDSQIVSASDRNLKKDINILSSDNCSDFIYSLQPVQYKYIDGTSNRYHHGFIAQDIKESMGDADWGLYVDDPENGKGLRYEELIADLVATVQTQNKRISELERKVENLTTQKESECDN